MAIGPVQLLVLGFGHPDFHGQIKDEKSRQSDTVRVIHILAVYKDADSEIEVEHLSNLPTDEAIGLGSKVAALVGLGIAGEDGMEAGFELDSAAASEGLEVFDDDMRDVIEETPNETAGVLILLEHHWAVGLRDAIASAGSFRLGDGFISPLDLIEIGLMTRAEAEELASIEAA